jgi:FdhD protein
MSKPQITHATRPLTVEVESINEHGVAESTPIAGEHPLTIYIDKREIVTLMTLGQHPEALVLGYLRNQRLVPSHRPDRRGAGRLGNRPPPSPRARRSRICRKK